MMMKCRRCNEEYIEDYRISNRALTNEEMEMMPYCVKCWNIIKFERVKFVKCPYKIPIRRLI